MTEPYANAASNALKRTGGVLEGFKEFISRGNAVDLAVGIVIGAAFGAVVSAIVDEVLMPLVGAIFGKPDVTDLWHLHINGALLRPFAIATALINFLIIAAAIYFIVVLPLNKLAAMRAKGDEPDAEEKSEEAILLTEIRNLLAAGRPEGPTTPQNPATPQNPNAPQL